MLLRIGNDDQCLGGIQMAVITCGLILGGVMGTRGQTQQSMFFFTDSSGGEPLGVGGDLGRIGNLIVEIESRKPDVAEVSTRIRR